MSELDDVPTSAAILADANRDVLYAMEDFNTGVTAAATATAGDPDRDAARHSWSVAEEVLRFPKLAEEAVAASGSVRLAVSLLTSRMPSTVTMNCTKSTSFAWPSPKGRPPDRRGPPCCFGE